MGVVLRATGSGTMKGSSSPVMFRLLFGLVVALLVGCKDHDAEPASGAGPVVHDNAPPAPVAQVETVDAWLDLVAQRPSAVVMRDGAVWIDLGLENARKHLALGRLAQWRLGVSVDDRNAGVVVGRTASVEIPLDGALSPAAHPDTEEQAGLAVAITLRSLVPKQSMTVLLNEKVLAHLQVGDTWERRTLSLPNEGLVAGDNRLRLHFRRTGTWQDMESVAAAVELIEAGTHERITNAPAVDDEPAYRVAPAVPGRDRVADGRKTTLRVEAGTALAYYVVPPVRGKLRLDVTGHGAVSVRASTTPDHVAGKGPTVLHDEPLRPTGDRIQVDLSPWGGRAVRLELNVRGSSKESAATVSAFEIVAPRSMPVDRRQRKPRDIVILTIEGARGDILDPGRRPQLPVIEELLPKSLVFERAYALSSAAVPSHAAWLSSVAPPVHLTVSGTFVADGQTLVPETLGRAGYFRAVVTANDYFSRERGLWQGFDTGEVLGGAAEEDHAKAVAAELLDRIASRRGRWFLLANVNDPQAPYDPPRELLREVVLPVGAPLPHVTHVWVGRVRMGKTEPGEEELTYVRRLYRGELQVVDEALGELIEKLRETRRLQDAIVIVMGVHGEEFFEHKGPGYGAGHGRTLYEESIRVPLIIFAPALLEPKRVSTRVDLLDLAPTIADLVGAHAPDTWQGESLLPVIDDPQPTPRLVVAYLGDGSHAAIVDDYKLIIGPGGKETFFDLGEDPGEQTDAVAEGGVALRMVRNALAWQLAHGDRWRRIRWGTGANLRPPFATDLGM